MQETPQKSHTVRNIILIVLALLLIGGVIGYFIDKNNKEEAAKKAEQAAAAKAELEQQQAENAEEFAAIANSGEPYVATINSNAGGKQVNGVITYDGEGNTSYAYSADGKDTTLVYTKDAYYLCNGNATCIKYPASQTASSGFDPSTYQFDGTKLNELKSSTNYKGQETCPAPATGTCDVWAVTSENGGVTTTFYVNAETKKIARVTIASGTTKSEVTYDYKNAKVTVPTNFTTAPTQ